MLAKILKFFAADPGSNIRDVKNSDPGSGIQDGKNLDPGSGIRDGKNSDPGSKIENPGWVKSQDPDLGSGSGMENPDHISES